jgi:hypothetical protein
MRARSPGVRRSFAVFAALLVAALIATEFEAVAHRHGDAAIGAGDAPALSAQGDADPGRPCSICLLAGAASQAASEPARVAAPPVVPRAALPQAAVLLETGPEPVRTPRAPPRPVCG